VIDLSGKGENEILRLAAIAETGSEHPLGQAVVNHAKEKGISVTNLDSFEAVSGHGLKAIYMDHDILIGNRKLMNDNGISIAENTEQDLNKLENKGKTAVLVSVDKKIAGIIALADTIKENAKEAIDSLKAMRLEIIMLTGDNEKTAKTVASKLGISRVIAQVLPQEKEHVISRLKEQEKKTVAMVGWD